MYDERSHLEAQGWTSWLPQGPSRPVILGVTSVASLRSLGVKEAEQVPAFQRASTVPKEAVPAAAAEHLFQQKTSLKGEVRSAWPQATLVS